MLTKLEDRVAKLEGEMDEVRHDASDDLAIRTELRAHVKTLEALRETQLEMGEKMDREFAEVRAEFAAVRSEMQEGFTKLGLGMAQITALLNIAIGREGLPD